MRKDFLRWFSVGFAVVFFIIALTLFIQIRSVQEELENEKAKKSVVQTDPTEPDTAFADMERRAQASELLALAQNAYYQDNERDFQGYMASLEGYADALSVEAMEIYEELEKALRGMKS